MKTLFFYIALPLSMAIGFIGAVLQIGTVLEKYREGEQLEKIVYHLVDTIQTTPPFSYYLDMPPFGKALVSIFFYSVLIRLCM